MICQNYLLSCSSKIFGLSLSLRVDILLEESDEADGFLSFQVYTV